MSDGCGVGPWDEGGLDLPLQEVLAGQMGKCPFSRIGCSSGSDLCLVEVVAIMVSGRGQLMWNRRPVWNKEGMGKWDPE